MRRALPLLLAGIAITTSAFASDPRAGDTRVVVEKELGKPMAARRTASGEVIAKYDRGTVTYLNDRAIEVRLLSKEDWEKRRAAQLVEEQAARARAEKAAAEKAARLAAGNAARDTLTASDAYKQLSTDGRLAALAELAAKHPDAELGVLRLDLEVTAERERAARKQASEEANFRREAEAKIAAFETQVAELRTRCAEAREVNIKLATRLQKLESDQAALLTRVNLLDELVRSRTPAPVPTGGTSLKLTGSVGSSDPLRN